MECGYRARYVRVGTRDPSPLIGYVHANTIPTETNKGSFIEILLLQTRQHDADPSPKLIRSFPGSDALRPLLHLNCGRIIYGMVQYIAFQFDTGSNQLSRISVLSLKSFGQSEIEN